MQRNIIAITSELLSLSLPDFFHRSSEDIVDKAIFEAPLYELIENMAPISSF